MSVSLPTTRSLQVFEAVARHDSVGRAALELHISQPAVSAQVAALERQVGAKLFDRQPRGVRLTAAGEVLVHVRTRSRRVKNSHSVAVSTQDT